MPTYTVAPDELESGSCTITGNEAHHLARVLRVRPGEKIQITDGQGKLYEGKIESVGKEVTASVTREIVAPSPYPITLFVSLLKREKMEWIAEKAAELNLAEVIFVKTSHSVVSELKPERMERIVQAASKQCGRAHKLAIQNLSLAEAMKKPMTHFICVEKEAAATFGEFFKTYSVHPPYGIWVGPEGGWDTDEKERMTIAGAQPITLGPLVLRAETAAMCAASSLIAVMGKIPPGPPFSKGGI
ncbi:MAG: RsmE family RNA methyltransferase [Deltaproteobacteria bacterium]|nr:RsmE family RNA methyltransferase [Deltaproteobacteria bacterium]